MIRKICAGLLLVVLFQCCYVGRFFIYNFADVRDYKKFPKVELTHALKTFYFKEPLLPTGTFVLPETITIKGKVHTFEEALEVTGSIAFIAIRNDSILYQWYRSHYDSASVVPSFSMAKSYVSALVGVALDEGLIKSTEEPITDYLDFLDKSRFGKITIQHLLDMQSGIYFNESYYNPFGDVAKYYYGTHLKKYVKHLRIKEPPGKHFEYLSINTQLLGLILEKATGQSLTNYLQQKIWSQIGTEFDASWSIDSKKYHTEKAFCCINACARDFAKFGRLYLYKGNWEGKQIVSDKWVETSVTFKESKNAFYYSNFWWHVPAYYPVSDTTRLKKPYEVVHEEYSGKSVQYIVQPGTNFYADGFLGQFIYVEPSRNIIFVRLGKKPGEIEWPYLFNTIARKN